MFKDQFISHLTSAQHLENVLCVLALYIYAEFEKFLTRPNRKLLRGIAVHVIKHIHLSVQQILYIVCQIQYKCKRGKNDLFLVLPESFQHFYMREKERLLKVLKPLRDIHITYPFLGFHYAFVTRN